jgi:general secretion pathway protein A
MYLKFFGLRENPFNVTSDPNFFYLSKAHREALGHLLYGIRERKGFLELTGEIGAGKTTVCKTLLKRLDSNTKTAFMLNSNLSQLQLLEAIVEDFGLTPRRRTKVTLFRQLNDFLLGELKRNANVVLILDEAQNLPVSTLESIRLLSNLETDKQKLVQILLVGQPELRRKLNSQSLVQLRQRIGVRFHINPLVKEEAGEYIGHRLRIAGCEEKVRFTAQALDKIFAYSAGVPRLINLVCDKALLSGFVLETRIIDGDIIDKSIFEIEGRVVDLVV